MKIVDDAAVWKIRTMIVEKTNFSLKKELMKKEIETLALQMQNLDQADELAMSKISELLSTERRKLNLPVNWPFDPDQGSFINPETIKEEEKDKLLY